MHPELAVQVISHVPYYIHHFSWQIQKTKRVNENNKNKYDILNDTYGYISISVDLSRHSLGGGQAFRVLSLEAM